MKRLSGSCELSGGQAVVLSAVLSLAFALLITSCSASRATDEAGLVSESTQDPRNANTKISDDSASDIPRSRIVNERGWDIPGLHESKVKQVRENFRLNGSKPVHAAVTELIPARDVFVAAPVELFGRPSCGNCLEELRVKWIKSFAVKGRVFGYTVLVTHAFRYEGTEERQETFADSILVYLDRDGDGRTESLELGGLRAQFEPPVPEWVFMQEGYQ